jgi:hypothetical protein
VIEQSPFAERFRSDMESAVAEAARRCDVDPLEESYEHQYVSVAAGIHAYVRDTVPRVEHDRLPRSVDEIIMEGGDDTEQSLVTLSLLASAGLAGRELGVSGGPPHSLPEVAVPAETRKDVTGVVDAVVDVYQHSGYDLTTEEVHWRHAEGVGAVFLPASTRHSRFLGDLGTLVDEDYVREFPVDADTAGGHCGYGYSRGGWRWACALDPLAHWYNGTALERWNPGVDPHDLGQLLAGYVTTDTQADAGGRLRELLRADPGQGDGVVAGAETITAAGPQQTVAVEDDGDRLRLTIGGQRATVDERGRPSVSGTGGPSAVDPGVDDTFGGEQTDVRDVDADRDRIERVLRRSGGALTREEIAVETGFSGGRVSQLLGDLKDSGRIERRRIGRNHLVKLTRVVENDGAGETTLSFCPSCGENLESADRPAFCPDCETDLDTYR